MIYVSFDDLYQEEELMMGFLFSSVKMNEAADCEVHGKDSVLHLNLMNTPVAVDKKYSFHFSSYYAASQNSR